MPRITKQQVADTQATHLYIYSDDRSEKAYRGQAELFAWYSHCYPIYTRLWCCADPAAQVTSLPLDTYTKMLQDECFSRIEQAIKLHPHKPVVIVPKIGEGCSQLKQAHKAYYQVIRDFLDKLQEEGHY
jgi:hypothetical protein